LEKQNYKCVLTDRPIKGYVKFKGQQEQTMSLDRIDNNKGYVEDNVQWVHKILQPIKMGMSEKEFLEWCGLVANYNTRR
jgi:hypothetical protein